MDDDWDDPWNYSCDSVGMGGGCGEECPVLLRGDCSIEDEMLENLGVQDLEAIGEDPVQDSLDDFDRAMKGI